MPRTASTPPYPPHEGVLLLRKLGWSMSQIAFALGSSTRTVSRWAAGYSRPLPTFEREIQKIVQAGGVQ